MEQKQTIIYIHKYGYLYTLVLTDRKSEHHPNPCFMGNQGYALQSFKKIKKEEKS
jgi:hypothetical protein